MTAAVVHPLAAHARVLVRHQVAAAIATAVDFGVMIALVEIVGMIPAAATLVSAAVGGVTNFTIARAWAFRGRHTGTMRAQLGRYFVVSLGGALLNAALLEVLLLMASPPYVVARAAVAVTVSLAYSYPAHSRIVFRVADEEEAQR